VQRLAFGDEAFEFDRNDLAAVLLALGALLRRKELKAIIFS